MNQKDRDLAVAKALRESDDFDWLLSHKCERDRLEEMVRGVVSLMCKSARQRITRKRGGDVAEAGLSARQRERLEKRMCKMSRDARQLAPPIVPGQFLFGGDRVVSLSTDLDNYVALGYRLAEALHHFELGSGLGLGHTEAWRVEEWVLMEYVRERTGRSQPARVFGMLDACSQAAGLTDPDFTYDALKERYWRFRAPTRLSASNSNERHAKKTSRRY